MTGTTAIGDKALAGRLDRALDGEVLFDAFSRGRYSTDASIYQVEPVGVVVPKTHDDVLRALEIAHDAGVAVLPRGGGTSQCGQTVNQALVIDTSKYLRNLVSLDVEAQSAVVEPGIVLDQLNAQLRPHGLWFPVDISTASRATIGGMTANNSCGARSIRYGIMRDNVAAIDAVLADGSQIRFDEIDDAAPRSNVPSPAETLTNQLTALGLREAAEIDARFPKLMRRVGGYNIDALVPGNGSPINLSHVLVGSEGTLAFFDRIRLKLAPLPAHRVLGVCHFPTFYQAMAATKHLVALGPTAVELVDRTMIDLARDIPMFRPVIERFVEGKPDALLLVEFAEDDPDENSRRLNTLIEVMADLGFPDAVVEATDPSFQASIWEVRKQGLNIMMSMKGDGKPVSFVEDCAVELDDLADYTARLTEIFEKHGTRGTWYAHASVGTLHVRPILNMKSPDGAAQMRAIAEEAFAMVRDYKGSHSGEHGDGIVRSEFHEAMFGARMVRNFGEVKALFDPDGRMNPGRIVDPPKMDDRGLFRFKPGYRTPAVETAFDWSSWGGFAAAVEMCNNNGACRKRDASVMCPSYRATGDEQHVTRGRANALRLALSGQLGPDALTGPDMAGAMELCVGCKACKRECPTGVDMAKMKTEVQHQRVTHHGLSRRDRLVGYLPRYAPTVSRFGFAANAVSRIPGLAWLTEKVTGFSAKRPLPKWSSQSYRENGVTVGPDDGRDVVLLADTFNRYFEPQVIDAALTVLTKSGHRIHIPGDRDARPLCCGRTFLAVGLIDEARAEAARMRAALKPFVERGVPVVGLEPSCLLTLRDEYPSLFADAASSALAAQAMTFEEYLVTVEMDLPLGPVDTQRALVHGHCHQKAFDAVRPQIELLERIPELAVETIPSSCCGMAGAFGYQAETKDASIAMAELSLAPAVRAANADTVIVADGTSCRHQIADLTPRHAVHTAELLKDALKG